MKSLVKRNNEIKYKHLKWDFIYIVGARKKCFQLMRSLNIRAVNPHSYKMLIFFLFKIRSFNLCELYIYLLYSCHIYINNWITVFGPGSHTDRIFLRMKVKIQKVLTFISVLLPIQKKISNMQFDKVSF